MANLQFSQFEAVIRAAIDPAIENEFDRHRTIHDSFFRWHPWKDDLRELAKLMNGLISPPHSNCRECTRARKIQKESMLQKDPDWKPAKVKLRNAKRLSGRGYRIPIYGMK